MSNVNKIPTLSAHLTLEIKYDDGDESFKLIEPLKISRYSLELSTLMTEGIDIMFEDLRRIVKEGWGNVKR